MSVSRPAACLVQLSSVSKGRVAPQCRQFHASVCRQERRRPRFASVKAADMGLISKETIQKSVANYSPFNAEEKAALSKRYTPEQLRVIEEGEAAIDPEDIVTQGRLRTDPYRLPYLDDLSVIQPVIDQKVKEPSTIPEKAKWLKDEQRASKVSKWLVEKNEEYQQSKATDPTAEFKPSRLDFMKFMEEASFMTGDGKRGSSVIAPALPKIPSMKGQYSSKEGSDPRDADGKWTRLMKQTGMTLDEIFGLKTKQLVTNFVTNQTRLGKIRRVYVLSIAGDGNGRLGIGEGKAIEPDEASNKALQMAIKNMRPIPRYEERTIFGEVEGKVAACEVTLMSRPPGFGLRCQHNIFEMARAAGIHDLAARVPRGRNPMNVVKATYEALMSQRIPDEVARGLGKKLVDVRKVYYGGDQPTLDRPRRSQAPLESY